MLRLPLDTGRDYRCAGIPFADVYLVHLRVAVLTFGVFTLAILTWHSSRHFDFSRFGLSPF